jgi:peptidoglycan-associated lipoprotein
MRHYLLNAGLAVALIATAACSGKKKNLPAAPPPAAAVGTLPGSETPGTGTTGATDTAVGNANLPGGLADFIAQSGSDRVLFGYDSYEIDDEGRGVLGKQAEWLARYGQVRVTIEGHTDERGTREYNLALGDRRANAAKNFLAAQGVAASRITTISFGKEKPEADGSDDDAYGKNRRAVTVIASGAAR